MSPRKQRRQPGATGGAYQNRTDLTQPVALPTGLPYGERQQLEQAQEGAPLPQVVSAQTQDPAVAAAAAHTFQPVGLGNPTQRPHEPITAGLPSGPGPGPEVLRQPSTTTDTLKKLALQTGNTEIQALANRLSQYGGI